MTWARSSACSMGTCVKVRHVDGHVEVRDDTAPDTVLHITPADWAAFLVGAKAGEFDGPAADTAPGTDESDLTADRLRWQLVQQREHCARLLDRVRWHEAVAKAHDRLRERVSAVLRRCEEVDADRPNRRLTAGLIEVNEIRGMLTAAETPADVPTGKS